MKKSPHMKKITSTAFSLWLPVAATLFLLADPTCAGETLARAYDIKNVSDVIVNNGGRVHITQGETESLRVEADSEVIDRVSVDLSHGKLSLSVKRNSQKGFSIFNLFSPQQDEVVYILRLKNLSHLGLSGASRAIFQNWTGKDLAINVSGAGDVTFAELKLDSLFVELSGASTAHLQTLAATKAKFELSGAANTEIKSKSQSKLLQVGASGASKFHGKLLVAEQADVGASGASNIEVHATGELKASASGASSIVYRGQPTLRSNSNGASRISVEN